jgi:pantoate--beta-alanine ligase
MMRVWESVDAWRGRRRSMEGRVIGVVPTMGALHAGHASLVERCRRENEVVVVTLFVNPSQFNDPKDLERYPRTLDRDLAMLRNLGADEVVMPSVEDLYPQGYRFRIEPSPADLVLEGAHRPGFLQGVLTIVMKLLNLVRADRAYFGEKDFQQLQIVTDMARDFFLATEIIPCPTVREASGLAMSSRNVLLLPEARAAAPMLHHALTTAGDLAAARAMLEAHGFQVDYVEERWGRRLAAATLAGIRLIDNVQVP